MHGTGFKLKAFRVLAGKCEGKGTPRRPIRSWEGDNKIDHQKIERDDVD